MRFLELKIPPPALVILTAAIMFGIWYCRFCPLSNPWYLPATIICGSTGLVFLLTGIIQFGKVSTTITPTHPEKASRLVITGIYRYSRNPMYCGVTLFLLALGIFLNDGLTLLMIPLFVVYLTYFQIIPEERILEQRFGNEYQDYKKSVRRWI